MANQTRPETETREQALARIKARNRKAQKAGAPAIDRTADYRPASDRRIR